MEDTSARRPGFLSRLKDGLRGAPRGEEPVPTVRVALNAYGKLPIYKDFISAGLTEPGAREFRNWIDRGFSHRWSTDEAYRDIEIPRHLFLLRLPESGVFVIGCLWGSQDEGGLRRFPFTLFATIPGGHRAADPLTATESLEAMNRQADAVGKDFGPGGSLAGFYRAYRGAELDLPVKPPKRIRREAQGELERVTISSFAHVLYGDEAPVEWPALLARLTSFAREPREDGVRAVRLPLSGALTRAREMQFWLLWLDARGPRHEVSGLLYAPGSSPARVALLQRDLRPEDFFLLHPARFEYPFAADFSARPAPAQEAPAPQAASVPAGWDRPLSSLLET
ncbi:MAG TPA: TagF domain-containing protein [Thermoanaerobaculia bacterium]|nr:TagF domain-containing protein [Thermoanaerobaculia bacterium]